MQQQYRQHMTTSDELPTVTSMSDNAAMRLLYYMDF